MSRTYMDKKPSNHSNKAYVQLVIAFWWPVLVRVLYSTLLRSIPQRLLQVHCYRWVASYRGCSCVTGCIAIMVGLVNTEDGIT